MLKTLAPKVYHEYRSDINVVKFAIEGFLTGTTGIFAVDGTVVSSSATGAYTAANIIANLQTATSDLAGNILIKGILLNFHQIAYSSKIR